MATKPHETATAALDRAVTASLTLQSAAAAAVVQLARTLAAQVDAAEGEPSTRLASSYLSVLKDLRRLSADDTHATKPAGRLAGIKATAARTTEAK